MIPLLLALLFLPAPLLAQTKPDHAKPAPARHAAAPSASAGASTQKGKLEPPRVLEITRSHKPDCEIKPVMTDAEIAACRQAYRK